jgi:hypothetical protein
MPDHDADSAAQPEASDDLEQHLHGLAQRLSADLAISPDIARRFVEATRIVKDRATRHGRDKD